MNEAREPVVSPNLPEKATRGNEPLEDWMRRELEVAKQGMLACVSATGLTKKRNALHQSITPHRGSVVAAPTVEADQGPDYFFHWLRDSALVMDALGLLIDKGFAPIAHVAELHDFVDFSLKLNRLSGRALVAAGGLVRIDDPLFREYLRGAAELTKVEGDRIFGDVRFNPNATLDILKWSRPQYDGPALRALTILRWMPLLEKAGAERVQAAQALVSADLDFLRRHFQEPCYDLWEARFGHHYHTRLVILSAFKEGSEWARIRGEPRKAAAWRTAAATLEKELDHHWSEKRGFYLAAIKAPRTPDSNFDLDAGVLLAVMSARNRGTRHSILDPRIQATMLRLEQLFAQELPINHPQGEDQADRGILFGRMKGDTYFGGGAFVMISFAAAEFYFQLADIVARGIALPVTAENEAFLAHCAIRPGKSLLAGASDIIADRATAARAFLARGDAIMQAFRRFVPESGELAEQMDKDTGAPRSANKLAWSYAAYIRAFEARSRISI